MTSCPCAVTVSKHELQCVPSDRIHWVRTRCPDDQPNKSLRSAGVLRYNRESDHASQTVIPLQPPPLTEFAVVCEYCGEKATPSINLTWLNGPEVEQEFCCPQQQELCALLIDEINLCEETRGLMGARKAADRKVFDIEFGFGARFEFKIKDSYDRYGPEAANVLRFRFSANISKGVCALCATRVKKCYKGEWQLGKSDIPCCDHKRPHFGLCYHSYQDDEEFLDKHYPSGKKFLTVFNDTSAHVYYPSGNLALVVVVTERNGKACVVFDDCDNSDQGIRAMFQSDGRATCYHDNGNIWLSTDFSGGQCLDKGGGRSCRWSWDTPLHPIFLSLNKAIGVRVFARNQVYVSFLAQGAQAKFSVGACCIQDEHIKTSITSGLPLTKDMLMVMALKNRTHLAIQNLQNCLMIPTHPQLPKISTASHFHVVTQRLQDLSANISMSEGEREFLRKCLQD